MKSGGGWAVRGVLGKWGRDVQAGGLGAGPPGRRGRVAFPPRHPRTASAQMRLRPASLPLDLQGSVLPLTCAHRVSASSPSSPPRLHPWGGPRVLEAQLQPPVGGYSLREGVTCGTIPQVPTCASLQDSCPPLPTLACRNPGKASRRIQPPEAPPVPTHLCSFQVVRFPRSFWEKHRTKKPEACMHVPTFTPSTHPPTHLLILLCIHPSSHPPTYPSILLSTHPPILLSTHPPTRPSIYPSPTNLSILPSIIHPSILSPAHPPTHPSISLPTQLSILPSINLPTHPPTHKSIHPSIYLLLHPPIHSSTHLSTCPLIHLSIHLPTHPSIYLFIHPPIYTSIYPFILPFIYIPTHPPTHPPSISHIS